MPKRVTSGDESELWIRAALGEFGDATYLDYEDPAYEHMYVRRYRDGRKFVLVPTGEDDFAEHALCLIFIGACIIVASIAIAYNSHDISHWTWFNLRYVVIVAPSMAKEFALTLWWLVTTFVHHALYGLAG